jgi:hypothetical protein
LLGVRPRHHFGDWLDALQHRPSERAGTDPAWP